MKIIILWVSFYPQKKMAWKQLVRYNIQVLIINKKRSRAVLIAFNSPPCAHEEEEEEEEKSKLRSKVILFFKNLSTNFTPH